MKKILALGVAFADDNTVTACKVANAGTVNLPKKYILAGTSGVSPDETFNFTFEAVGVTGNTLATMPVTLPTTDGAVFESENKTQATANGTTVNATIELPEYTATGYYWYKVTETDDNYEGVTYHDPFYMKVTVTQGESAYELYVAFYGNATVEKDSQGKVKSVTAGEKIGEIENTYTAGQLVVTKNVDGQLGDKQQDFEFVINLAVAENSDDLVESTVSWSKDAQKEENDQTGTVTWTDKKEAKIEISLKHGESITINNIPSGVVYTVTESAANSNGYTTTYKKNNANEPTKYTEGITGTISGNVESVNVTNTNGDNNITTGMLLDNAPYMIIMALVLVGAAMMLKRRAYND